VKEHSSTTASIQADQLLVEFVEQLQKIKHKNKSIAKLNTTTISDNNGGRIKL
jgi:hypothetical protein